MKKFLTGAALFLFTASAFADICAWTTLKESKAAKALVNGNKIMQWCTNCNDKASPGKVYEAISSKVAKAGELDGRTYYELQITQKDNKGKTFVEAVDLSYVYVNTGGNIYANLANLVGCYTFGEVTFIQTFQGNVTIQRQGSEGAVKSKEGKKIAFYFNEDGARVNTWTNIPKGDKDYQDLGVQAVGSATAPATDRMPASKK